MVKPALLIMAFLLLASSLVGHHIGDHGSAVGTALHDSMVLAHEATPSDDGMHHLLKTAVSCLGLLVLAGLILLPRRTSHGVTWTEDRPRSAARRAPPLMRTPVSLSVVSVV